MLTATFLKWCIRTVRLGCLILAGSLFGTETVATGQTWTGSPQFAITNCLLARQIGVQNLGNSYPIRLEGQVCWVSPTHREFAMMDASGGVILEMEDPDQKMSIGQRLRLTGYAVVMKAGDVFKIGVDGLIVDDDGLHPMTAGKAGAVFLNAGKIPIRVDWFNGPGLFGLEINYEGSDLPRTNINAFELFRNPNGTTNWVSGLDYRCYEGWWTELPDFKSLKPVKTGTVDNFDLAVRTRDEGVGLQFTGFFEVPRDGIYKFNLTSDDGSRLFVGKSNIQVEIVGQDALPAPRQISVGQILDQAEDGSWSQIEGNITQVWPDDDGLRMELSVGLAHMQVKVTDKADRSKTSLKGSLVRVTGFCEGAYNSDGLKVPNLLLVPGSRLIEVVVPPTAAEVTNTIKNPATLPVLTTADEVHHLKREEAQLGYPVNIRGVVTSTADPYGFTLRDSTSGVFVLGAASVRVGDFVAVEGVTDPGAFAPMIKLNRMEHLGMGRLPEPIRPTWEQLINGSMDAQYVEIEGIVTIVNTDELQLLTPGGVLTVAMVSGLNLDGLKRYENKLVRIRGGLIAWRNNQTHQVILGKIDILNPNLIEENSTSEDIFSIPYKTPAELLLFDPQASLFQRIKMSGQIVYVGEDMCFMIVGTNGVRFVAKKPVALRVGDMVDVAGYPQLGGASPLLREAVVHKTGQAILPEAKQLSPSNLFDEENDSTRVSVEGVLARVRKVGTETILEMQDGARSFVARLDGGNELLYSLPTGSRLELTGVYEVQGVSQRSNQHSASFELLLDSPANIKVLAHPPWWTLRRLLVMVGMLACVLIFAILWITQLHRKVEERTDQLKEQIQKRQNIEQHRAMERERARIAQDLHDELGSSLTEIGMLATISATVDANQHLEQIGDRARHMITSLDEIVWATNPKHDSLESLGSYLCLYADRFLKPANITCRLKGNLDLPGQSLNPIHRHEFFLVFKEALTNVVRHSGATEVRLSIRIIGNRLRLSLADNGGGLGYGLPSTSNMDGLANMRARLEKMGGRFAIASQTGRGTTLRFYLPLN